MYPTWLKFLFLVALATFITFWVVLPQANIIEDSDLFWRLWLTLMFLSFWSSATEAAFSVVSHDTKIEPRIASEHLQLLAKNSELIEEMAQSNRLASASQILSQIWFKIRSFSLRNKRFTISENGRGVMVGTFATVSVLLNTALAVFMPLALQDATNADVVTLYIPNLSWDGQSLTPNFREIDLSGKFFFNFVIVSLPLLALGKIVPKQVGMKNYKFFAVRLNFIGRFFLLTIGWVSAGMLRPFVKKT